MNPRLGGDGARGIKCGMYVIVDMDQPKPNTFPVEYKELAASAHTSQQAWRNYEARLKAELLTEMTPQQAEEFMAPIYKDLK